MGKMAAARRSQQPKIMKSMPYEANFIDSEWLPFFEGADGSVTEK